MLSTRYRRYKIEKSTRGEMVEKHLNILLRRLSAITRVYSIMFELQEGKFVMRLKMETKTNVYTLRFGFLYS